MRGQPDHGDALMQVLLSDGAWSDVPQHDLPPEWRSLGELDDELLVDEAARVGTAPRDDLPADGDPTSPLATALDGRLDALRDEGVFDELPDMVIDVRDVAADPFGDDSLPFPDLAPVDPAEIAADATLVDPFDAATPVDDPGEGDADRSDDDPPTGPQHAATDTGDVPAGDITDDITDDITGGDVLDRPVRVDHHDPFDATSDGSTATDPFATDDLPVDDGFDQVVDEVVVDLTVDPADDALDDALDGAAELDELEDDDPFGDEA